MKGRNPILFFLFFSHFLLQFSDAANNITQGQFIKDGETLISEEENFVLGFFSPKNSTNRYVGIWYNKISLQTVVWVANRETPLLNKSGILTVADDGNLKVLDGNGIVIWSTNGSIPESNSTVLLMDSGNLLLCSDEEVGLPDKALWQSFEDPTDTFLPGMRAGLSTTNGKAKAKLFSSWKNESDPSSGNYTMGVDPHGVPQIVIWENSKRLWRSGLWNGQVFIGIPNQRQLFLYGFKLSDQGGRTYFTYTQFNTSDVLRFRLRYDGIEEQLQWDEGKKQWHPFWSQPVEKCQVYNKCGAYASCDLLGSPMCTCLKGFQPKSSAEWARGNWSSGCVRRTALQCERNAAVKGDGFRELVGLKLPDNSVWKAGLSRSHCEDECLKNCSCKAFAYVSGIGCLIWGSDLVDVQKFPQIGGGGTTLHLRLAHSEIARKKIIRIWISASCSILGVIILSTLAYFLWRRRRKAKAKELLKKAKRESIVIDMSKSKDIWNDFSEQHDIGEGNSGKAPELPLLSFESMEIATNNFSDENRLGQGGFGVVYKGILPWGVEVAIKRLSKKSGQGSDEFKNEVILIAKLQHRNLVRLLGCCIQGEERMLVYEYLPNKSLDAFIFDSTLQEQLDWRKRFNIIEGIARGLLYLHRDSRLRIIHRDLKASNILLDEEMNPKISDFGMAKIFGGNDNPENTNRVVGTYGYMAPEYAMEGLFSVKSDVYSFGVLLLEIISGKKSSQFRYPEHPLNLLGHVWKLWNEERAMEFLDPCLQDSFPESEVMRCIQVGLLCVQDSASDRPTMSTVILMLESESTVIPPPRQPTFTIGRTPVEMDLSLGSTEITSSSRNDVTVTMLVGR